MMIQVVETHKIKCKKVDLEIIDKIKCEKVDLEIRSNG